MISRWSVLGTLILAFGWFGFNPGSTLAATDVRIGSIAVCTMLATAAGCLASLLYMWAVFGKPDPTMGCNGLLAGAGRDHGPVCVRQPGRRGDHRCDRRCAGDLGRAVRRAGAQGRRPGRCGQPSTAVNGAWGCLSIGLFATGEYGGGWNGVAAAPIGLFYGGGFGQLAAEAIGVVANFVWVFGCSIVFFKILDDTMGNRVSAKAEIEGLDIPEMGVIGYINEDSVRRPNRRSGTPQRVRPWRTRQDEALASRRDRRPPLSGELPTRDLAYESAGRPLGPSGGVSERPDFACFPHTLATSPGV